MANKVVELDVSSWKRVIFFRSARPSLIATMMARSALRDLRDADMMVVAQEEMPGSEIEELFGAAEIVRIANGFFRPQSLSPRFIARLRRFNADAFIIFCANSDRKGYGLIETLGLLSGAQKVVSINDRFETTIIDKKLFLPVKTLSRGVDAFLEKMTPFMHRYPRFFMKLFPARLYPQRLLICLTQRCNLKCDFCTREHYWGEGEEIKFENLKALKNPLTHATTIDISGYAEVFIYSRLEEALDYIFSLNDRRELIQVTTNGAALSRRWARKLKGHLKGMVISLNAADPDSYRKWMKHDFHKTVSRIREFVDEIGPIDARRIQLHFVTHRDNIDELERFVELAEDIGVYTVSFHHLQVFHARHIPLSLITVKDAYNAAVDRAVEVGKRRGVTVLARKFFSEKAENYNPADCRSPFVETHIGINGEMAICCYCGGFIVGHVFEQGFDNLWFGEVYTRLRQERYLDACKRCVPSLTFDDHRAHFHSLVKELPEFEAMLDSLDKTACDK